MAPEPAPPVVVPPPPAVVMQSFAYVAGNGPDAINMYRVEDSGALVSVDTVSAGENVRSVTIHPSNRFAYGVNSGDDNISTYSLDPSTGRLTNRVDVLAGQSPRLMRIHPSGTFAYVTNFDDGTVSIFNIDSGTGALTVNTASPVVVGASTSGIMIDPTGRFLFVESDDGLRSYSIAASGALNLIDTLPMASPVTDFALSPSGGFLYAATADGNVSRHSINGTGEVGTGAVFAVGSVGEQSVYIEPRGRFAYVTNRSDNSVVAFGVNPLTGDLNFVGPVSPGTSPRTVAMGPTGEFLYATSFADGTVSTYSVNQTTGALAPVGTPLSLGDALVQGITIATFPR